MTVMKLATRARKERFIKSFNGYPFRDVEMLVARCLQRHGIAWLTADQVDEVTDELVRDARFSQRLRVRNRHVRSADLRRAL